MTTIQVYRNRRNSNKYIEVHNDGHYHNSLKQYIDEEASDEHLDIAKASQKELKQIQVVLKE